MGSWTSFRSEGGNWEEGLGREPGSWELGARSVRRLRSLVCSAGWGGEWSEGGGQDFGPATGEGGFSVSVREGGGARHDAKIMSGSALA